MKYLFVRKFNPITPQFIEKNIGCFHAGRVVQMDVALALEQDEIAAGYILTCQSRPTSEEMEIKY